MPCAMKSCAYCGRENHNDATHCHECGTTEFVFPAPLVMPNPSCVDNINGRSLRIFLWIIAIAVIAFCLVVRFSTGGWLIIPGLICYPFVSLLHFLFHSRAIAHSGSIHQEPGSKAPLLRLVAVSHILFILAFLFQYDVGDGWPTRSDWLTITALLGGGPGARSARPPAWWPTTPFMNVCVFIPVIVTWALLLRRHRVVHMPEKINVQSLPVPTAKRPALVWVISIVYLIDPALTLLNLALAFCRAYRQSGFSGLHFGAFQQYWPSHYAMSAFSWSALVAGLALTVAAVACFFFMKREAWVLFLVILALYILKIVQLVTRNGPVAAWSPALIGALMVLGIQGATVLYCRHLIKIGTLR